MTTAVTTLALLLLLAVEPRRSGAFVVAPKTTIWLQYNGSQRRAAATDDQDSTGGTTTTTTTQERRRPCFYRPTEKHRWRPRLELSELQVGQELTDGVIVQELLEGTKTGPKLFVEVGVGRCRHGRDWKIINAMLRLGSHRRVKKSVTAKRAARLRKRSGKLTVYVSRIRLDNDQLEVCLNRDEALAAATTRLQRVSVSTLQPGQEVTGTVVRVERYGVLVDVGANRHGLLHIQRVSRLLQRYIDKARGLQDQAGLTPGTAVRLQVHSNARKRLFLDFTKDVYEEARVVEREKTKRNETNQEKDVTTTTTQPKATASTSSFALSPEEEAAWAAYAAADDTSSSITASPDDDGDYDEDRAIEDAFGMGTYWPEKNSAKFWCDWCRPGMHIFRGR